MLNFHVCSQSNLQSFFCEEHFDQKRTTNLHSKQILSSPGVTWVRWTVTTTMLAKRANLNQRQRSCGSNINFIIVPPKHRICLWNVLLFRLLLFSNAVCVLELGHHLTGCVRPATDCKMKMYKSQSCSSSLTCPSLSATFSTSEGDRGRKQWHSCSGEFTFNRRPACRSAQRL